MTGPRVSPVLVTGATGRIGRLVVAQLLDAGVRVRALTRRPDDAKWPAEVEVVAGDFTAPESIEAALGGVSAVFLLWTAPLATVPAVIERLASPAPRIVFLSSPHRTPHPLFQRPQPNAMSVLHADTRSDQAAVQPEAIRLITVNRVAALLGGSSATEAELLAMLEPRDWTNASPTD